MSVTRRAPGGGFLIDRTEAGAMASPEDFTEEQQLFAKTTAEFVDTEVLPHDEAIEGLDYELTVRLMRKAGEVGLLGADVPEAYGGLGLDKISSALIAEQLSRTSSFALSVGAHTGIGTLPIVFFGSPAQKAKYLPRLATGELIAAYCLTEPASGSDALAAKTTARLTDDGSHYVLNGSKLYITNAGFADLFIVYAKVDGEKFTAFIVERDTEGFTFGPEEKKMGIKGSSTRPLFFEDAKVPADNVLGEIGRGHVIAFNILNIGRYKLGVGALGGCKETIALAASFANERQQFGKPIASFPLVAGKLADMNVRTFALESMAYRTAGLIDASLEDLDPTAADYGVQSAKRIAEYAVECSIVKVFASEALDFVADEGLQIHGGAGYIQEYKIERIYRDSRINRIFEGTNEINRLLIPGTLLKKAMKGELPLLERVQTLQAELLSLVPNRSFEGTLAQEAHLTEMARAIFLMTGGAAVQRYGLHIEDEQEALAAMADIAIAVYAMESALLRARKRMAAYGEAKALPAIEMAAVFIHETFDAVGATARRLLASIAEGDTLRTQLAVLKKMTRTEPVNLTALTRAIATRVIRSESYAI